MVEIAQIFNNNSALVNLGKRGPTLVSNSKSPMRLRQLTTMGRCSIDRPND